MTRKGGDTGTHLFEEKWGGAVRGSREEILDKRPSPGRGGKTFLYSGGGRTQSSLAGIVIGAFMFI